jgi:glyoxylate/hydroxypyruvate reductase A
MEAFLAILIIMPGRDSSALQQHLRRLAPGLDVRTWPDQGDPDEIRCAVTWNHPHGLLREFNNLTLIHSFGAGVDHLLQDHTLPVDIPICRVVDLGLASQMCQYLQCIILNRRFAMQTYWQQQQEMLWQAAERVPGNSVGILGLGKLGEAVARSLVENGFTVHCWSRTEKQVNGIISHTGTHGLEQLAASADYLVCLLPLTAETRGILNRDLFLKMKPSAYLINVGRGGHLLEEDLVQALNSGQLSGACLDVTASEPLPASDPLWTAKNITITPHISSLSDPLVVAEQVLANYQRRLSGRPVENAVNRDLGY